jgi:hypothetical protein
VYGKQKKFPLKENFSTDKPLSFYAATKKCNDIMAYSYSEIYKLKCTGLRFFTVYGPWGRPDMAYFRMIANVISKSEFNFFGDGIINRSGMTVIYDPKIPGEIFPSIPLADKDNRIINANRIPGYISINKIVGNIAGTPMNGKLITPKMLAILLFF